MAGNFFRGTSVEQDGRWGKSDEKLMAKMAKSGMFAPILDTKVNPEKINLDVINKWITQKIIEVVGFEDDILINLVINMLQGAVVDGKKMQLDVTGFLEKQAGSFVEELWTLLVDAQNQPSGIPSVFLQRKKEEILSRQQQQGSRWGSVPTTASASEGKILFVIFNIIKILFIYILLYYIVPKQQQDVKKREHSPDDRENDKQRRRDRSRDNRDSDRDYTRYTSRSDRHDRDRDRDERSRRDYDRDSNRDYRSSRDSEYVRSDRQYTSSRGDRQRSPDRRHREEDRSHTRRDRDSDRHHHRDSRDRHREGHSRDIYGNRTAGSSKHRSRSRSSQQLTNKETGKMMETNNSSSSNEERVEERDEDWNKSEKLISATSIDIIRTVSPTTTSNNNM